jgi:uncharacterized protein (DUF1800 family)
MKKILQLVIIVVIFFSASSFFSLYNPVAKEAWQHFKMPYKQAGLTERQAAAHLLDRFTFGATPSAIDEVQKIGLEKWFDKQLQGDLNDSSLNNRLAEYDALNMSNADILKIFPRQARVLKQAIEEGFVSKDSIDKTNKADNKSKMEAYRKLKGYRPESELFRQFINQKILSAAYSKNQLQQVLTEFWFNHFNVSLTKNGCAQFIPAYERDVIRPNVTGKFSELLLSTAQSPAMLLYLDNFSSAGVNEDIAKRQEKWKQLLDERSDDAMMQDSSMKSNLLLKIQKGKKNQGLNENYAREIMELHTLGVDGGYTQQDVTQAARVLTGWTVYPMSDYGPGNAIRKTIDKIGEENLTAKGFVHSGDFLFAMNRHDKKEKIIMGTTFAAGGGYEEGIQLINMLAHHSSTAKFIGKKLAVRFVSDDPPQSLVDKMAASFAKHEGDIKQVLITMVSSPEFWQKDVVRSKTKSPFELAISAVRTLNADLKAPFLLNQWITRMGQKLYYYQAPTGFPDKAQYWINTGSLLNRMNFGLALAGQKIPGTYINLSAINNNKEPESAEAALSVYAKLIMPERNIDATTKRLTPLISDPAIQLKIKEASARSASPNEENRMARGHLQDDDMIGVDNVNKNIDAEKMEKQLRRKESKGAEILANSLGNNSMLAQVVGIILGSPEFQRR